MEAESMLDLTSDVTPETKREKTIHELYTSEQTYVANLQLLMDGYLQPLKNPDQKSSAIINSKVASGIFSNIESIFTFHNVFIGDIEKRVKIWHDQQVIGDIFLSIAPYLKLYTQYCSNYDYSINLVQLQKKTNPAFQSFLQDMQEHSKFNRMYITSFLILPIQRIPRYEMFLKELVKLTAPTHPDYACLTDALDKVAEVATFVNEACIKAENMVKIIDIGKTCDMDNLLTPGRDLLREFKVEVTNTAHDGEHSLYLFNDAVLLALTKKKNKSILHPMHECWVKPHTEEDAFQLVTVGATYFVKGHSEELKTSIEECIEECVKKSTKHKSFRQDTTMDEDEKGVVTIMTDEREKKKKKSRLGEWKREMKKMKKSRSKKDDLTNKHLEVASTASANARVKSGSFQHASMSAEPSPARRTSLPHDTEADVSSYRAAAASAAAKKKTNKFSIDHHSARELRRSLSFKKFKPSDHDSISRAASLETVGAEYTPPRSTKSSKKSFSSIVFRSSAGD